MFNSKSSRFVILSIMAALSVAFGFSALLPIACKEDPTQKEGESFRIDSSTIIIEVDVPMGRSLGLVGENWCNCTWSPAATASPSNCPGFRFFNWSGSTTTPDIRRINITRPASCVAGAQTVTIMLSTNGTAVTCYLGGDVPWACLSNNTSNFCIIDNQLTFDDPTTGMFFTVSAGILSNGNQVVCTQCSSNYLISVEQRGACGVGG